MKKLILIIALVMPFQGTAFATNTQNEMTTEERMVALIQNAQQNAEKTAEIATAYFGEEGQRAAEELNSFDVANAQFTDEQVEKFLIAEAQYGETAFWLEAAAIFVILSIMCTSGWFPCLG